jgi:UPF0716 family protein affecting phage T7 exclusion
MLDVKMIIRVLNPHYTVRYLYFLLLAALVPFMDCYFILLIAHNIGEYLFLAMLISFSLIGFFLSMFLVKRNLFIIRTNTANHYFSEYYYNMLAGTLFVSFFLIMPGILGSIIALILCIPFLRYKSGKIISSFLKIDWKEIHEFINVID